MQRDVLQVLGRALGPYSSVFKVVTFVLLASLAVLPSAVVYGSLDIPPQLPIAGLVLAYHFWGLHLLAFWDAPSDTWPSKFLRDDPAFARGAIYSWFFVPPLVGLRIAVG